MTGKTENSTLIVISQQNSVIIHTSVATESVAFVDPVIAASLDSRINAFISTALRSSRRNVSNLQVMNRGREIK